MLIQFSSVAQSYPTLCDPVDCSMPGLPVHCQLPELTQTHVHWVGDAIQPSHPLLSPSPPDFTLSQHQGTFQWVSSSHQVAKVLEFQLQYQSFQWTPRLISFRMDWLDLLAVQRTLKSLLQHHSSKASILRRSAFCIVQRSHPSSRWCHPTISSSIVPLSSCLLPSIRVFSNESVFLIRWPKYWSFSFSISPSKEHPGMISFRMDWLDLLEVQGTLKSIVGETRTNGNAGFLFTN